MSDEQARIAELELEAEESGRLRESMADKLTSVANALKGKPAPLTLHSWHDLPEVAERAARELAAWRAKMPLLDALAEVLGVCEGVCPLGPALAKLTAHAEARQLLQRDLAAARERIAELERELADYKRAFHGGVTMPEAAR